MTEAELASMIDHTFLKAAGEPDAIEKLCEEARTYKFACAMVNPCEVKHAAKLLEGSGVRVGTVIDFPLGQGGLPQKIFAASAAIGDGARDVDYVIDIRMLKSAAVDAAIRHQLENELTAMNTLAKNADAGIVTKLIIECCYLGDSEKVLACNLAKKAGFSFVKTSTGFGTGGATVEDVKLMRDTVGPEMGVKAAGGIRTLRDALAMIDAGANRLGCSAGASILAELRGNHNEAH